MKKLAVLNQNEVLSVGGGTSFSNATTKIGGIVGGAIGAVPGTIIAAKRAASGLIYCTATCFFKSKEEAEKCVESYGRSVADALIFSVKMGYFLGKETGCLLGEGAVSS